MNKTEQDLNQKIKGIKYASLKLEKIYCQDGANIKDYPYEEVTQNDNVKIVRRYKYEDMDDEELDRLYALHLEYEKMSREQRKSELKESMFPLIIKIIAWVGFTFMFIMGLVMIGDREPDGTGAILLIGSISGLISLLVYANILKYLDDIRRN
ncbi:hypothetical protein [Mariniplasma anaerobium]|uniref:Uncharacterized protein n=1 Tax=Mariniplasma anaerobium TaxID=2735436 RepID=A0A7U9XVM2_9MOLU|nr:hypothetical protein [Mariniplasma anaerobium]BCR36682.1 hypothetical protein MPAN_015750 [Mariniplasma anaerobium]